MLLWVLMDVGDHIPDLPICGDWHTSKGVLEQTACPPVGSVDRLGVGIEEVRELIANISRPKGFPD